MIFTLYKHNTCVKVICMIKLCYIYFCFSLDIPIWECNVHDAIVPELCKLSVRAVIVEVKLKKRRIGLMWPSLHDVKVCS